MASQNYEYDNDTDYIDQYESDNDFIDDDEFVNIDKRRKRKSIQKQSNRKLIRLDNDTKRNAPIDDDKQCLKFRIDSLCEYAHVLMHCVLYKINYYNKKTHFEKLLKYDIIVYKCKSEIVCEYISNCIESMRILLYKIYKIDDHAASTECPNKVFSIGLALLKTFADDQPTNGINLLIKRYTLQIESLDTVDSSSDESDSPEFKSNEWNFRDSILKCLYSKDLNYPANFKWQIQIRTSMPTMSQLSEKEDLFKLFAWRQCDQEEVTSITTKQKSFNRVSIKPIKTINYSNIRAQLFIEQPTAPSDNNTRQSFNNP